MNGSKNSLASQRTLVFITAEYPFGKQETFIENEIFFLSEVFDHIIVLPKNNPGNPRKMPPNCTIGEVYGPKTSVVHSVFLWKEWLRVRGHLGKVKIIYRAWQSINKRIIQIRDSTKESKGDIVYYSYWLDEGAAAAAYLAKLKGCSAISRAHGWDVYPSRHPYNFLPFREYLADSPLTVCPISAHGMNALRNQGFTNLNLFYLGTPPPKALVTKPTPGHQDIRYMVSVSSIIKLKRVQRIAEIFLELRKRDNRWHWHHFGDGPLEAQLKSWLAKRGADGYCLHGRQSNETVREWLGHHQDNTLFINQSTTEGLPVSMMEAMSYGIPCVGTWVGGVSEIIDNGHNGLLHDVEVSPDLVVRSIERLDEQSLKAMGESAKMTWENRFNAEDNYALFVNKLID